MGLPQAAGPVCGRAFRHLLGHPTAGAQDSHKPEGLYGYGDPIDARRAGRITQAFRRPLHFGQVHTAGFYDDAGFCQDCDAPYCYHHWQLSGSGYGYCPAATARAWILTGKPRRARTGQVECQAYMPGLGLGNRHPTPGHTPQTRRSRWLKRAGPVQIKPSVPRLSARWHRSDWGGAA